MIWAFDVRADAVGSRFAETFHHIGRRHELLIRPIGRTVYLMPPYLLDEALSRWLAQALTATLTETLHHCDADRAHPPAFA
jgi:adenosylmethionine-8-amino-7-oxononanoate aminotransferase